MDEGLGIIRFIKTIITIISEVIGFFSIYFVLSEYKKFLIIGFGILSPIIGGIFWNYLCQKNKWRFHMGGEGNEPYGIYAFIWGVITILPVIFLARVVTITYKIDNRLEVFKWFISNDFLLIILYTIFAGIAAVRFYGIKPSRSMRLSIYQFIWKYKPSWKKETIELIIILIWAGMISLIPTIPLILVIDNFSNYSYLLPTFFSVIFCCIALSICYAIIDPTEQLRGFLAGFSLRFGMYWGLLLALDNTYLNDIIKWILYWINKPF